MSAKFNFKPSFFADRPNEMVQSGDFTATALKYESGVAGVKMENGKCSIVVLPYMGMQVWFAEFGGKNLTMKSIFDEPLATTKYGDNYGALLLHCGLSNLGCPPDGLSYPLHGELPFAVYNEGYVSLGQDEFGEYMGVGGTYVYRNSQEYNYAYMPELRMYKDSTLLRMFITIENRRANALDYMFMCHINWLAVDGSRVVYSAPHDKDHIEVYPTEMSEDSERARAIAKWYDVLKDDPTKADVLDKKNQAYDPEMCINYTYKADEAGWAHAMQVMPDGDATYVGWRLEELPYALRWACRTGDEDGLGIALPSTGNHLGTDHQKENGLYNTIPPHGTGTLRFDFGYLSKADAAAMETKINQILGQ